ncbi:MAG: aspartate ammonia-lyase [Proteobacteria bacterium]|nr:aspartate ammonia-lyase [Pseudomonadota bacterium]
MNYRVERDTLGEVRVPFDAYYGAQTARAVENFPISGMRAHPHFIRATAMVKYAAAKANMECGVLDKKLGNAIVEAAKEVMDGKWKTHFVVDVFQAGAGTSHNMNANEVIANRAIEILGGKRGEYTLIHPNDHVNMSQSTNDTFPSSMRIATLMLGRELLHSIEILYKAFKKKSTRFNGIMKSGRTHLQDAVPVRLGQEFGAYALSLKKGKKKIEESLKALRMSGLGATAAGTGMNTPGGYRKSVINHLSRISGFEVTGAKDFFEATQSMADFANLSSSIKNLALEITRICNDLRLMSSGPRTGLAEINLPPVQPGSSIMPGKVNPVMAEALNMVAFQVAGNDHTVSMATQAGQLELNVMMPVINHNILTSMEILKNGLALFAVRCVDGITANEAVCSNYAEKTVGLATVLNLHVGYNKAAEISKKAVRENKTIRELVLEEGLLSKEEIDTMLDIKNIT